MELAVYNIEGKDTGRKLKLNKEIFGAEVNEHAIYLDVKQYLANQRQGTHKTKQRAEVNFSTKKIKKQKGTGGARAGSIKSPVFVGGGTVFGPQPRDYGFKLNKKVKRVARKSALSAKANSSAIRIVEDFKLEAPKTKAFAEILKNLEVSKKALVVVGENDKNVYLSVRNLPKAKVVTASDLNTYDIMNAGVILMSEGSIGKIEEALKS